MEYLSLGRVKDAFGLDGSLKIFSTTNMSNYRYQKGAKVFIYDEANDERKEYVVLNYRHNGNLDFVKLEEIATKEDAFAKKGQNIYVVKDNKDLAPNTYFYSDLEGCEIIGNNGKLLGKVVKVEEFPAQITLRVAFNNKNYFVPFISPFIKNVDIENKKIEINEIEGLIWELRF